MKYRNTYIAKDMTIFQKLLKRKVSCCCRNTGATMTPALCKNSSVSSQRSQQTGIGELVMLRAFYD